MIDVLWHGSASALPRCDSLVGGCGLGGDRNNIKVITSHKTDLYWYSIIAHKILLFYCSAKVLVKGEPNVSYICSRYYRAPELIFGATDYTCDIGKTEKQLLKQPLGKQNIGPFEELCIHAQNQTHVDNTCRVRRRFGSFGDKKLEEWGMGMCHVDRREQFSNS